MAEAIKQFNANLNYIGLPRRKKGWARGENTFPCLNNTRPLREVHNAEVILVTVIYYAVIIIIGLLIAVSDTSQAAHIIAVYARMVH